MVGNTCQWSAAKHSDDRRCKACRRKRVSVVTIWSEISGRTSALIADVISWLGGDGSVLIMLKNSAVPNWAKTNLHESCVGGKSRATTSPSSTLLCAFRVAESRCDQGPGFLNRICCGLRFQPDSLYRNLTGL